MEAPSQQPHARLPPAGPRRPLSFVPTDSPRCPTGGKTSNGVRRHGANLVSGQMLLQMFRRRPRSSVTGATCRRLPEVESGSCPCPSASASAPQALSSRSPALGHCPGGPQQPRLRCDPQGFPWPSSHTAWRPMALRGRQGAGCLACRQCGRPRRRLDSAVFCFLRILL